MGRGPSKSELLNQNAGLVQGFVKAHMGELAERGLVKENRATLTYLAKQEFSAERFEQIAQRFAARRFVPTYKGKKAKHTERRLNIMLSDLHYGADLDPRLVQFPYGPVEESRRTAGIVAEVIDYKRQYRGETELDVHLLGDLIQGKIHDPQNAAVLTVQIDRALHCLVHAIEVFAREFKKVRVMCSVGNHGRDAHRHVDRALTDKYDSNEFRLYRALYYAFRKVPNVEVITPTRAFYLYDTFDDLGCMTHGDTVFNPGYPGKVIDVGSLKKQINEFKLAQPEGQRIKVFGMGHVHTAMDVDISGSTVITNGCLIPTDEYAQSVGIFETPCKQQLWEAVRGHPFGDHRKLDTGRFHDEDPELDKLIPTWEPLP